MSDDRQRVRITITVDGVVDPLRVKERVLQVESATGDPDGAIGMETAGDLGDSLETLLWRSDVLTAVLTAVPSLEIPSGYRVQCTAETLNDEQ